MRIFLQGIDRRRITPGDEFLSIELESPLSSYHAFTIRMVYKDLRKAGLTKYKARWVVYDLLQTGRHIKLGDAYR